MRAMILRRFGGPEVLEPADVDRPKPGVGELLVRVVCAGTNPVEAKLRQDGSWAGIAPPAILGYDVAGIVEALGDGVEDFAVGDAVYYTPEIFGNAHGGYAEYNAVPARIVARKPRNLSFAQAAAVPLAGGTAWEAIVRHLAVRPGETVLVHGGAVGVGSFAVQFAKAAGARVLATASAANHGTLRALGADVAIDYTRHKPADVAQRETEGRGVDAVFDTAGHDNIAQSLAAVRPFGRLACILPPSGSLDALTFRNLTLFGIFLTREAQRLDDMRAVIEQGRVEPLIAEEMPLADVRKAHERLDSGHGRGKVVLRVSEDAAR